MRLLPLAIPVAALLAACVGPTRDEPDGWSVERRFDGLSPTLLSISTINAGTPPAAGAIQRVQVRARERGRQRIIVNAEAGIAATWTPGAALFDPQLDLALERLARLGADEPRAVELRLTLMPASGARRQELRHAADRTIVVDLLVPVPSKPRSRSAELDAALATGLHEAAHALRPRHALDRHDDEYRASLVAACFRIDGAQRGDRIAFSPRTPVPRRDFTRLHSDAASHAVQRDLSAALGAQSLDGGNHDAIAKAQAFCARRLSLPHR